MKHKSISLKNTTRLHLSEESYKRLKDVPVGTTVFLGGYVLKIIDKKPDPMDKYSSIVTFQLVKDPTKWQKIRLGNDEPMNRVVPLSPDTLK